MKTYMTFKSQFVWSFPLKIKVRFHWIDPLLNLWSIEPKIFGYKNELKEPLFRFVYRLQNISSVFPMLLWLNNKDFQCIHNTFYFLVTAAECMTGDVQCSIRTWIMRKVKHCTRFCLKSIGSKTIIFVVNDYEIR